MSNKFIPLSVPNLKGKELEYYAIEKGLLKDCEDFYDNKHTNSDLLSVNFTDLSDEKIHELLFEANENLYFFADNLNINQD